jgi:acetyl esterase/lipase
MALTHLPPQPPMSPEAERYAAWCIAHTAQAQACTNHVLDIPYGSDYWHKLDIYLPEAVPTGRVPVLLFMHGGYWTHGYKDWLGFMAPAFISLPALFISVDYRLAPAAPYPAALEDCLAALAWTYHHVRAYGGDPQQLFVGGHSAGGHLAALMTLQPALLTARGLPADGITACFPVSGVYDLDGDLPPDRLQAFLPAGVRRAEASPIHHTSGNQTPFLLAVGERDFPVLYEQAYAMAAALRRESSDTALLEIAAADHFQINQQSGDPDNIWVQRVRAWMQQDRPGAQLVTG